MSIGRIEVDTMYRNLMDRFRWGGFDKYKMFVDESYSPSIQTQQFAFWRLATTLKQNGDKTRALKVVEKMFESFPHMNFPIDENYCREGISLFIELGAAAKAKPHVLNLANASAEKLKYFSKFIEIPKLAEYNQIVDSRRKLINSIIQKAGGVNQLTREMNEEALKAQNEMQKADADRESLIKSSKSKYTSFFENEIVMAISTAQQALDLAEGIGEDAFKKQIETLLAPYGIKSGKQSPTQIPVEAPKDTSVKDTVKK
jgi:hypothetical protein